ncbi:hypothetical protein GCM10009775_14760 [Microbacterium aoyamense]|uniref:Uncharacterized protein n=1 Tax=Microbacterium aoyamense TaxID=344166 RepID=A0ABP5AVL7_9MICO|nr:hypothetical protein [Microbacterium aoyamense]
MPRSSVVLGPTPTTGDAVASAAAIVLAGVEFELRALDEGAVLQVVIDDVAVLSVLRPRLLPVLDEIDRLLPGVRPPAGTRWWTDAYTPWGPGGEVGAAVLDEAARASHSSTHHQGLAPSRRSPR